MDFHVPYTIQPSHDLAGGGTDGLLYKILRGEGELR